MRAVGSSANLRNLVARKSIKTLAVTLAAVVAMSVGLILAKSSASATTSRRQPSAIATASKPRTLDLDANLAPPVPVPETVDLFGDSLGYQAEPYLDMFFADTGTYVVSNNTFGGTATCDWFGKMAAAAGEHPKVAVLVFSGNAFTPCMDGVALRSAAYYALYATDTEQAIGIFRAVGAHVFLVGTPIDEASTPGWDRLDDIYQELAQADPLAVTYVNAGAAVESTSGGFTWQLPCLSMEPSCGANGMNIVRSPDGIHFCPDGTPATLGLTGPCDEYSPGAFRFALSIVSAVMHYRDLAPASLIHTLH